MRNRRFAAIVLAVAVAAMTIAATTASARPQQSKAPGAKKAAAGGVFRVEWESSFDFTGGFDPTGEYLGEAFGIYSNLLVRTLVGYNHVAGAPGNVIVPDLATNTGVGHERRQDLHVPPQGRHQVRPAAQPRDHVQGRPVRVRAHRHEARVGAQYGFYYDVIKGMTAFKAGKSKVDLGHQDARPEDDHLHADPAHGRLPATGSACRPPARSRRRSRGASRKPNEYGRYVISSGPYMIAGSDKLNASSCDTIKAAGGISGWDGEKTMDLVRNPDYDPATDSTKARENFPDEFTFTVNSNVDDIYASVGRGDIEEEVAGETPSVLREYKDSPQLHTNDGDRTWYLTMNLTQAPFDDLHVRRAVNFVVNREALRKAWGGASAGSIATHIAPDAILPTSSRATRPTATAGAISPRPRPR